jgi:hypothetical protein
MMACAAGAQDSDFEFGGHTKFRLAGQSFPDDSLYRDLAGRESLEIAGDLRLNLEWARGAWSFDANYQLLGLHSDYRFTSLTNDDRRLFNLTDVIDDDGDNAFLHRLDRFWVGHTSEKTVLRFGRQALSWGNGMFYAPMDLVNPFDPTAVDTEYKAGDDMLYVQYLRDNGDDVQGAIVFRRDLVGGDVESDQATVTLKYHGFAGETEYDLLVAQSYGDPVVGIGGSKSVGGAVWRGDIVVTDTDSDTYIQLVTNLTYSWIALDKNMSGAIEYYFNGFGQHDGRYDPASLATNPELTSRFLRNELYALGRHYVAGSVLIEMSPLWTVTPTVLGNVSDPSALFQLVTSYSLSDNMTLLGSLNVPMGGNGTEFGGVDPGVQDRYLSLGAGIFAQFAWYF